MQVARESSAGNGNIENSSICCIQIGSKSRKEQLGRQDVYLTGKEFGPNVRDLTVLIKVVLATQMLWLLDKIKG